MTAKKFFVKDFKIAYSIDPYAVRVKKVLYGCYCCGPIASMGGYLVSTNHSKRDFAMRGIMVSSYIGCEPIKVN